MYEIKPTFNRSDVQIDLPTCMYKMKTINEFGAIETHLSGGQQMTNGLNGNGSAAVSLLTTKSLPDVSLQIEKFLKVFCCCCLLAFLFFFLDISLILSFAIHPIVISYSIRIDYISLFNDIQVYIHSVCNSKILLKFKQEIK